MSAQENLSPGQFGPYTLRYDPEGNNTAAIRAAGRDNRDRYHAVVAHDETGNEVGSLAWAKPGVSRRNPGEIGHVDTHPAYRHQGIATALYHYAANSGIKPSPKHSPDRSDKGDDWARSVGGKRPRRSDLRPTGSEYD